MTEPRFARQFLRDLGEWESQASTEDRGALEKALAAIVRNPRIPGRIPNYYDPARPSYLFRSGPVLIHFRDSPPAVEFLNLFFSRV